jgi:hypothetical protein
LRVLLRYTVPLAETAPEFHTKEFLFGRVRADLIEMLVEPMQGLLFKTKTEKGDATGRKAGTEPQAKRRKLKLNEALADGPALDSVMISVQPDGSTGSRQKRVLDECFAGLVVPFCFSLRMGLDLISRTPRLFTVFVGRYLFRVYVCSPLRLFVFVCCCSSSCYYSASSVSVLVYCSFYFLRLRLVILLRLLLPF